MRDKLWACARASTKANHLAEMLDLKEMDAAAYEWISTNAGNPKHWCKAFFSVELKSDMLCNNLSESFNSFILSAKDKPIITMLERIRRFLMERIKDRKFSIGTKPGPICPKITKILDRRTIYADGYTYTWNGVDGFKVYSHKGDHYKVDLRKKECSCRIWKLSDIPCIHAILAIYSRKQDLVNHVSNCYQLTTFGWMYENVLKPMTGPSEWENTDNITLLPPKYVRQAGRPKLSIRKDITEIKNYKGKQHLTKWYTHTCKYCGVLGHNVRTCTKKKAAYQSGEGETSTQNRNEDEVIDSEQADYGLYLQNLMSWFVEMHLIVPSTNVAQPATNVPANIVQPAPSPNTPAANVTQPALSPKTPAANVAQFAPSPKTPAEPQDVGKEAPTKPRKKKQRSSTQPIPTTTRKKTRFSQS
ncbi:hypothetical protein LIER_35227 [Lithospermum erythrorhizon]|uniref:SWIM-type domain-containing protein n=1 Tax=Lithospermum erythrorhizon TaxID=34254 RepID=A0AAV3NMG9_LITER